MSFENNSFIKCVHLKAKIGYQFIQHFEKHTKQIPPDNNNSIIAHKIIKVRKPQ